MQGHKGQFFACGRHWVMKESSYRIDGCWQCLQNRIMSHSAPIHDIWDLNYEVAGRVKNFKESQQTDERRTEESWNFLSRLLFNRLKESKSLPIFRLLFPLRWKIKESVTGRYLEWHNSKSKNLSKVVFNELEWSFYLSVTTALSSS